MEEIFEICDSVSVFRNGTYVNTRSLDGVTRDELISMMVGRDVKSVFPKVDCKIGDVVFKVENLCGKGFHNISFEVHAGEILGISGLVGSGRSETMRAIFGLDPLESGKMYLDGKEIKNELIYGSVSGKKIDENGEALEGAVIGIFKAEETEFTKDTALMTTTSAKDGSFSFAKVPYGKWIVREIEQPKGFVLDEKAYEVNISKAEQVVEIEIVNEYVHGNIRLTKVDAEYPDNKLTGATFEVYKDTNENGKIDDGDELIGNLEETETGIYEMKELLYGKYIVRETKAPEGFLLDKGEYSVFIEKDETTYSVENKAGVGFINEAMRGTLKIVKTSSDGKVKGFAFRVTGANGYDMTFETDKNGEIVIEGLRIGEYTVSEVANNASAAYITPADQNVTIKLDETAVVKMHNELRDTPKTGDDTNMKLWYVLAGLSAVGIAVTSVVAHKKKKKEGNE